MIENSTVNVKSVSFFVTVWILSAESSSVISPGSAEIEVARLDAHVRLSINGQLSILDVV